MLPTVLPAPRPGALDELMRNQGLAQRRVLATHLPEWESSRIRLREAMFAAMGVPRPETPCPLEPRVVGVLERTGYRIEKLLFQTLPDVWATASAYVPTNVKGQVPAVLVVHGHWAWARRDPVVQARCLGLVKLGFFVLAIDAFGAGERFTTPGRGTYHGALYGSTLWPTGRTLLGQQVYDNRRAVDYLLSRPEVNGQRLGITGASGGGNQSMYAGALDERFQAVVPVCSVGTYQAYLHAACCVCEALPGGLSFTEEGDVLGLVAPRSLLVLNATRDAFQFSVEEARKSLKRAQAIYDFYGQARRLGHVAFESPHDYNREMREAMYGWMTLWLKEQGDGRPIPEPTHTIETPEALAIFTDNTRPKNFLFPPSLAAREARTLLAPWEGLKPKSVAEWDKHAGEVRQKMRVALGAMPPLVQPKATQGAAQVSDGGEITPLLLYPEAEMPLPTLLHTRGKRDTRRRVCVLLHLDGKAAASAHPLAAALLDKGWAVVTPDLRGTGETQPKGDTIGGAPDHNSAEHALWMGRPLLGQWAFDVLVLLEWIAAQPTYDSQKIAIVGLGQAGLVAVVTAVLAADRVASVALMEAPATLVTDVAYPPGTRMGLLASGLLRSGDIPHLAALIAPRPLVVAGPRTLSGASLSQEDAAIAFEPTRRIYTVSNAETHILVTTSLNAAEVVAKL